jgi:pilus assembly protein TadC
MSTWVVAVLAGWAALHLLGADRRFPWRVGSMTRNPGRAGVPGGAAPERRSRGRTPWLPPARRRRRRHLDGLHRDLVLAVDLLAVAVSAGHSLHGAVGVVARRAEGPVTTALGRVDDAVARGVPIDEAIASLVDDVGAEVRPLVSTLQLTAAAGTPLGPALARLAEAERRRARRRAETRVRRLPVLLLGPVVGLVLPAFVVLTLVPVAAGSGGAVLRPVIGGSSLPAPSP